MSGADVAPGQEQVGHILGVERAQRDGVRSRRIDLDAGQLPRLQAVGRVRVHGPATVGNGVVELRPPLDVRLGEDVVAHEPARLALAHHRTHPVQLQVLRLVGAVILDVVPQAVDHLEKLVADELVVRDGVLLAAPLDPPVAGADVVMLAVRDVLFLGVVVGPRRRRELDRVADVASAEHQGAAQHVVVAAEGSEGLARLAGLVHLALAAVTKLGPRLGGDAAVSAGVNEDGGVEEELGLRAQSQAADGADGSRLLVHRRLQGARVEEQDQVLLPRRPLGQEPVPVGARLAVHREGGGGAEAILDEELIQDARLPGEGVAPARRRAGDADAYLVGGVAAQHRTVLDEGGVSAVARRGDGGASARQPAADDDHIKGLFHWSRLRCHLAVVCHMLSLSQSVTEPTFTGGGREPNPLPPSLRRKGESRILSALICLAAAGACRLT